MSQVNINELQWKHVKNEIVLPHYYFIMCCTLTAVYDKPIISRLFLMMQQIHRHWGKRPQETVITVYCQLVANAVLHAYIVGLHHPLTSFLFPRIICMAQSLKPIEGCVCFAGFELIHKMLYLSTSMTRSHPFRQSMDKKLAEESIRIRHLSL